MRALGDVHDLHCCSVSITAEVVDTMDALLRCHVHHGGPADNSAEQQLFEIIYYSAALAMLQKLSEWFIVQCVLFGSFGHVVCMKIRRKPQRTGMGIAMRTMKLVDGGLLV